MESAAKFFELLGCVIDSERAQAAQYATWKREFAGFWWDLGMHIARKPDRAKDAAKRRVKSRGSWNKS